MNIDTPLGQTSGKGAGVSGQSSKPDTVQNAARDFDICEVLVVGGGPGGSTIATRLAELDIDVVLLEKDRHPRFHIGESLLPLNVPLLERLGVADEIKRIGMPKWGV